MAAAKSKRARKRHVQQELFRRGGKRNGAGRKPKGPRAGSPHKKRPTIRQHPSLATDRGFDALPVDSMEPQTDPVAWRPDNPQLADAWKALWHFNEAPELSPEALKRLNASRDKIRTQQGERYDLWVAGWLREWLEIFPDKVLFATDGYPFSDALGWEEAAFLASRNIRQALGIALTGMLRDHEVTRERAAAIARGVVHDNAAKLSNIP